MSLADRSFDSDGNCVCGAGSRLKQGCLLACEPQTSDLRNVVPTKNHLCYGTICGQKGAEKKKKYSKMHAPTLNQSSMVNGPDPETFLIRTTGGYAKMEAGCWTCTMWHWPASWFATTPGCKVCWWYITFCTYCARNTRLKHGRDWKEAAADADQWMMEADEIIKFRTP